MQIKKLLGVIKISTTFNCQRVSDLLLAILKLQFVLFILSVAINNKVLLLQ
jgi:hypothetical protein